jgi:hypothetical protein
MAEEFAEVARSPPPCMERLARNEAVGRAGGEGANVPEHRADGEQQVLSGVRPCKRSGPSDDR